MKRAGLNSHKKLTGDNRNSISYLIYLDKLEEEDVAEKEIKIHSQRLLFILNSTLHKLRVLAHLPHLLDYDGEILREYLPPTNCDFIVHFCNKYNDSQSEASCTTTNFHQMKNLLIQITANQDSDKAHFKLRKETLMRDKRDVYVSQVVDLILNSKDLVEATQECETELDVSITNFICLIEKLKDIITRKLKVTARDELEKENEIKMAFRTHAILIENLKDVRMQLEQQRKQLGKEKEHKAEEVKILKSKIHKLKAKFKDDINKIVLESEKLMMEDAVISEARQAELSVESEETTELYQKLLSDHLLQEKAVRAKRLKVETQLASWLAKYDQDIGDRQAEIEELQKAFDDEKNEYDNLQDKFDELEEEYVVLMAEKEEEERLIFEEKALQFLMNRAARIIQRNWRAYKERKLARKKARKGKKKGSAGKKGGKKGGGKGDKSKKDEKEKVQLKGGVDPNIALEGKFNADIMGDLQSDKTFAKEEVIVDLAAD